MHTCALQGTDVRRERTVTVGMRTAERDIAAMAVLTKTAMWEVTLNSVQAVVGRKGYGLPQSSGRSPILSLGQVLRRAVCILQVLLIPLNPNSRPKFGLARLSLVSQLEFVIAYP